MNLSLISRLLAISVVEGDIRSLFASVARELFHVIPLRRIVLSLPTGSCLAVDAVEPHRILDLKHVKEPESFRQHAEPFAISPDTEPNWLAVHHYAAESSTRIADFVCSRHEFCGHMGWQSH
jgi:hypothetical protein